MSAAELWSESARPLYEAGEYTKAAAEGRELVEAHPEEAYLCFNTACCESRAGETARAVDHLRQAIELWEGCRELARNDADFDAIRDEPSFQALVGQTNPRGDSSPVREARLTDAGSGLAPATEGWFVVNVRDAEWWHADSRGARCSFDNEYGSPPIEFPQLGINLTVLEQGQTTLYHAESTQEAFLVLSGKCRLIVEGEERVLRPWDFFHSPPWTEHAFVGAGDEPCVILMTGARGVAAPPGEGQVRYPASELAARFGASVPEETSDPEQAYATAEWFRREHPSYWAHLPWS